MADKDTLNLIKFKFGSFQSIKDLSSKDQSSFYFASDAPAFYNAGLWYGVSSLTSSVNEETGEVTLVINGGFGDKWKSSQVTHKFVAGMTTQQKADLAKAVSFVNSVTSTEGEDTQTIIDKWNEIVKFLAGFEETDVLLERITTLENEVDDLKETTIAAGDGLTGGGDLSANRTIGLGKPSTITDSSTNSVTAESHTHAIDEASTEQRGIVRLNNSLESDSTDQALTAKQGKVLKEHIDETVEHIDDMFELIDKGNGTKYIKSKYGFASDSFISSRGVDNESSGVGGLDAQAVWDLLMQNDDATKIINIAHIPDISIAKIPDIANASVANAKTLDGVALNRFPYIYGYKGSLDLNTYVDGENKFYSLFIGAGHSSIPSGATYSTLLNVAGYNADTSFQLIGCQFQDKLYYRGGSSSPDNNSYIFNKDWKQIAFRETTLSGYGITDAVTLNTEQAISGTKTFRQAIIRAKNPSPLTLDNADPNYPEIGARFTLEGVTKAWVGYREDTGVYFYTYNKPHRLGLKVDGTAYVDYYTIYHAGNLSPVTTNTDQTITGVKTFSNLRVNNATMITNLNAEMASALNNSNGRITNANVGIFGDGKVRKYTVSSSMTANKPPTDGSILHFSWDGKNGYEHQLFVAGDNIDSQSRMAWRTQVQGSWCGWKIVAFTDTNSLNPSGGTLTINGNLTVSNRITIGNATLYWDVANQCLRVNAGIASDSFLSAKGVDTTGNGQGGGGGLDATMLWNELTISSPTNAGKVISSQFLPVQEILTPVAEDISAINVEIIALQDRIANIEQALTWQTL